MFDKDHVSPATRNIENCLTGRIQNRTARISVLGLGYVGLPLATAFASAGFSTHGLDISERKIDEILHSVDDTSDAGRLVGRLLDSGSLTVSSTPGSIAGSDIAIICVPTPLNKSSDPDLSYVTSALTQIIESIDTPALIVLESTTYPGTTREVLLQLLLDSGRQYGTDFLLAFSPERIDPGNHKYNVRNTPKIVGGIEPAATRVTSLLYSTIADEVVPVSSADAAEMTKLLENTFRSVNIALANETALMCDRLGIDVWEVVEAAATKPFGFMPFYPGPGIGGHCIPLDPHYLSWKLETLNYQARFIQLASQINREMPGYVVSKIVGALNIAKKSVNGSLILILGVAYKKDISDTRESPAHEIFQSLTQMGASVYYHDPYVSEWSPASKPIQSLSEEELRTASFDCAVVLTDHTCFDYESLLANCGFVVDSRNAVPRSNTVSGNIFRL